MFREIVAGSNNNELPIRPQPETSELKHSKLVVDIITPHGKASIPPSKRPTGILG